MQDETMKIIKDGEEIMKNVGSLDEAAEQLESLTDDTGIEAEEVGSFLGEIIKGIISVFKF